MGDGLILEEGTHDELLRDEKGAYSRLVAAQKLREKREIEIGDTDSAEDAVDEAEDMAKKAREEIPLGRKNTNRSLASEIIEKRKQGATEEEEEDHSLPYMFYRMAKLNRAGWLNYSIGAVAACSQFFSFLSPLTHLTHSLF